MAFLNALIVALKGHQAAGLGGMQLGEDADSHQLQALLLSLHAHRSGQLEVAQGQLHQLMQHLLGHVLGQEAVVPALAEGRQQIDYFTNILFPVFLYLLRMK